MLKNQTLSIEYRVNFRSSKRKQTKLSQSSSRTPQLSRITRLLALAHHLQKLVEQSVVRDYADIARLTGLSRARLTQIMNLALLAPPIQEEIILAPALTPVPDYMRERALRMVLKTPLWEEQLKIWEGLKTLKF